MGLSLLRKEALYPPRALFAQIGAGAVTIPVVSKDPIPMEWWSFFQGKRSVSDRLLVFCKRRSLPAYSTTMRLKLIRAATMRHDITYKITLASQRSATDPRSSSSTVCICTTRMMTTSARTHHHLY